MKTYLRGAAVLVVGLVGGVLVAVFGGPGLVVATVVLVGAALMRSPALAAVVAIAGAFTLGAWALALVRCEPTFGRACSLEGVGWLMLGWPAGLAIAGALAIYRNRTSGASRVTGL